MQKLIILILVCAAFHACQTPTPTPPNTLTQAEKDSGWKLLFDGQTGEGWHSYNKPTLGKSWKVIGGALTLDSTKTPGQWQASDGGDICTAKEYENFEFTTDWKICPCGNSGIMILGVEDTAIQYVWQTGPEIQILDNTCHEDGKIIKHRAGDLYDIIKSSSEPVKPAGEWNTQNITLNKGHLILTMNGVKVVETDMWTDDWKKLVAASKFKDMPKFAVAHKGHIALQDHGFPVYFRNIKIREL